MSSNSSSTSCLKTLCTTKIFVLILVTVTCTVVIFKINARPSSVLEDCVKQEINKSRSKQRSSSIDAATFFHSISQYPVMHSLPGLHLYIYTALLDERYGKIVLRIFALEEKGGVSVKFKCKYMLRNSKTGQSFTKEVPASQFWVDRSWPTWSPYFASEYNCAIPKLNGMDVITFVSTDNHYEFNLPIEFPHQYKLNQRTDIGVCIKPMTGRFEATKMVEWIETLKAVGFRDIIVYQSDISGPGRHVLDYYQQNGLVKTVNFPFLLSVLQAVERPDLTAEQRFAIYQQVYLIAIQDCLYRFSSIYKYLSIQDADEIILPQKEETISKMLTRAEKLHPQAAGFLFQTFWHWEDFGRDSKSDETLYMQKYSKSTLPQNNQPKSIISTDRAISLNFHSVLDVPNKKFQNIALAPFDFGGVHHFRGKCTDKFNTEVCKKMLSEVKNYKLLEKYKKVVQKQVKAILSHLKMA